MEVGSAKAILHKDQEALLASLENTVATINRSSTPLTDIAVTLRRSLDADVI